VGTGHSLANKTLVFDIKLVGLNGLGETTKPKTEGQLNMTFDYYDKALAASYNVDKFPTLVWNCERNRIGTVSTGATELEALGKLTCVFNKGQPKDVCAVFGVAYNNETGKIMADQLTQSLLSKNVGKTGLSSCSPNENRSVIQAFYSKDCATCASQKEALDQLSQVFADYLNVTYYCAGDEQYCLASSRQVL
jgi:hypothetical protein